jgi:hypothetical protein
MCGYRLRSIRQTAKRPTGAIESLQALKFNKCGKHADTLSRTYPSEQQPYLSITRSSVGTFRLIKYQSGDANTHIAALFQVAIAMVEAC